MAYTTLNFEYKIVQTLKNRKHNKQICSYEILLKSFDKAYDEHLDTIESINTYMAYFCRE